MSPPVKDASQSKIKKKPNQSASKSPSTRRKRRTVGKKDDIPEKTDELPKTLAVPPIVPTKSNRQVTNKKNQETLKMIHVSDVITQSVQKPLKSNTMPDFASIPKLKMITTNSQEASNVKSPNKNVSVAKTNEQASPQIRNESSSMPELLGIDQCSPPKTLATSKSNNVSTEKTPKKVLSKMIIPPETQKNAPTVIQKKNTSPRKKASPKASKSKPSSPNKKKKQTSTNNQSAPAPKVNTVNKTEPNKSKKRPTRGTGNRDSDMKEPTQKIESIYIADGLREDCQNLVEKCLQVFKLNFEKFCEIWKQMDFPCVFHGRQSGAEIAEFSEEAIHIAKSHMVAKNVNFEENVAGLFLVYAFLNHQPYKGFAALRLVPEDVPSVLSLEAEARKQRRYDVLYILGNVLIKGPCEYHVLPREVGLEMPIRKYHDGSVQMSGPNVESVFSKTAECVQQFKELIGFDQRYAAIRQKLRDRHGGVDKVRNLCKQPAAQLFDMYRSYVPGGVACERDIETVLNQTKAAPPEVENRVDLVRSIKDRAMAKVVDPMRHLTGLEERQQDTPPDEAPKSSRHKGKGKGKGRASARMLQSLFAPAEEKEEVVATEFSQKAMPTLNMSEDMLTVTHLALPKPSKRQSLSSSLEDKPPNKRTKLNKDITIDGSTSVDGNPIEKQTENLEKESSTTKANIKRVRNTKKVDKTKKKHEQETLSNSDLDLNKKDNIPIDLLVDGNVKTEVKINNKNKSQSQILDTVIKVPKGKKSNAKNIKIKSIEIIKPADTSKTEKPVPCDEEINVQLDSIPIEILSRDKNIEIEVIDNFKGGRETSVENEEINPKDAFSKKDSTCEIVKSTESATKLAPKPKSVKDVKSTNMHSTEMIAAIFQRRNKRESKRLRKQGTDGVHKHLDTKQESKESGPKNAKDHTSKSVKDAA